MLIRSMKFYEVCSELFSYAIRSQILVWLYIVNGSETLLQTHKVDALESNKNLAFWLIYVI